jgi:hypothetical protein
VVLILWVRELFRTLATPQNHSADSILFSGKIIKIKNINKQNGSFTKNQKKTDIARVSNSSRSSFLHLGSSYGEFALLAESEQNQCRRSER